MASAASDLGHDHNVSTLIRVDMVRSLCGATMTALSLQAPVSTHTKSRHAWAVGLSACVDEERGFQTTALGHPVVSTWIWRPHAESRRARAGPTPWMTVSVSGPLVAGREVVPAGAANAPDPCLCGICDAQVGVPHPLDDAWFLIMVGESKRHF